MSDNHTSSCTHLDQRLRWLGVRDLHGRKVFVFQCPRCRRTFFTHTPPTDMSATRSLMDLSITSHT